MLKPTTKHNIPPYSTKSSAGVAAAAGSAQAGPAAKRARDSAIPSAATNIASPLPPAPSSTVSVCVRVRPLNSHEQAQNSPALFTIRNNNTSVAIVNSHETWTFDRAFGPDTSTRALYESIAGPIVASSLGGINGTIFAYGQTASGKTYTMQGSDAEPGIIPLAAQQLFSVQGVLVQCSYVEVYNENIKDLLSQATGAAGLAEANNLKIGESAETGFFIKNVTEVPVDSPADLLAIFARGEARRHVAGTDMNEKSSRSHAVLSLTVTTKDPALGTLRARLSLVDLAGSENVRSTRAEGERLKEGSNINTSLLTLSRVVAALADKQGGHVPFRDSTLTRILQPSLAGNCRTLVVCCLTPAQLYEQETRSTLKFATSAKKIKTTVQVNVVSEHGKQANSEQIERLQGALVQERQVREERERELESEVQRAQREAEESRAYVEAAKEEARRMLAEAEAGKAREIRELEQVVALKDGELVAFKAQAEQEVHALRQQVAAAQARAEAAARGAEQEVRLQAEESARRAAETQAQAQATIRAAAEAHAQQVAACEARAGELACQLALAEQRVADALAGKRHAERRVAETLSELEDERRAQGQAKAALEQRLAQAEAEAQAQGEALKGIERERQMLETRAAQVEAARDEMAGELGWARSDLAAKGERMAELGRLLDETQASARSRTDELSLQLAQAEAAVRARAEEVRLCARAAGLTRKVAALKDKAAADLASSTGEMAAQAERELAAVRAQLEGEMAGLKEAWARDRAVFESRVAQAEAARDEAAGELGWAQSDLSDKAERLVEAQRQARRAEGEAEVLKQALAKAERERDDWAATAAEAEREQARLRERAGEKDERERAVAAAQADLQAEVRRRQASEAALAGLQEELVTLRERNATLEKVKLTKGEANKIKQLHQEYHELKKRVEQAGPPAPDSLYVLNRRAEQAERALDEARAGFEKRLADMELEHKRQVMLLEEEILEKMEQLKGARRG